MKPLIKLKTTTLLVIPLMLACFALLPTAQAETLPETVTPSAFVGTNTFDGFLALDNNTTGFRNSAFGAWALQFNTTGVQNVAVGAQALRFNNASFNTAVGDNALLFNTTGISNMALGQGALRSNTTGDNNVAMGFQALNANTSSENVAVGTQALRANTTGNRNVAIGFQALNNNTTAGNASNAVGWRALFANTTGLFNNAVGWFALGAVTTGDNNTAMGDGAGPNTTTGNGNLALGANAGSSHGAAASNVTFIAETGDTDGGQGASNRCYAGRIHGVSAGSGDNRDVFIDADGQLNAPVSSRRFKKDIKPMDQTSVAILKLQPVTFHYKDRDNQKDEELEYGLIAEDVAEVNPDWVGYDDGGEPEAVRYTEINVMLLNEFIKEHKKVEEQQASIAELKATVALQQKGMEVLTAQLKEQAAQIQRVSAQVELNKPAPSTVANK